MSILFSTVLVANRGEIACRVIRTLRHLGIRSVAVHSDADADARHVREADVAIRLGPAAAAGSYLNIEAILAACRLSGAEAVHPGYGFLSESLDFARALKEQGLVFIGPDLRALEVMGDKIRAKNHVQSFGVPVIPGIARPGLSDEELIDAAAGIGYPLLIKPSAGGGGKGMQAVDSAAELPQALITARRIATAAFGDDTLFLERLVERPRHIEVQVLGDRYGHVVHLGERECSLQRRHQKVIEEAPSPLIDEATRARIGEAACQAARSVNYLGAGTVEFLVSDAAPEEFFFMEMNTRLQVEHPVTEMVTHQDLVEWQVRLAAGEELTLRQEQLRPVGHAVEARLYAEDPAQGFLPQTGTVLALREAEQEPGTRRYQGVIRYDSALQTGLEITAHYDPMLAKIIAWGPDRQTALAALDGALADTVVLGVQTNAEYLRLLLGLTEVQTGQLDTGLIERTLPGLRFGAVGEVELQVAAEFFARRARPAGRGGPACTAGSAWKVADGWRLGEPEPLVFSLTDGTRTHEVLVASGAEGAAGRADFQASDLQHGEWSLIHDDVRHHGAYALDESTQTLWLGSEGRTAALRLRSREERVAASVSAHQQLRRASGEDIGGPHVEPRVVSPMPGTVVSLAVVDGETVLAGQLLLAVEAMKMEHEVRAGREGTVHLLVHQGSLVTAGQVLATLEPHPTKEQV
ncbi:acetyl/propionyl/methylcrotonyl-CoA carboxylase subunit alpha [Psychromicrobium xiongbiense]|uniref:acetyl/propionyl/methylcrotonyl-CoA carboxylase subunit alpha n=1 Tax=Psychromicrobium xiongbiense TaxID=3051184 RepID=UPI002552B9E0|nr:biotin carboxylase N-terminal domain-containing protein [Psychromicrobium sp. YIM S02556]